MDIKQIPIFSHAFLLSRLGGRDSGSKFEEIQKWCNNNCNGRWMTSGGGSFTSNIELEYCSSAKHISPISDEYYPHSSIRIHGNKFISFENEADAMAFKLTFIEEDKNG